MPDGAPPLSTQVLKKRARIFTTEDVAKHSTSASCWITRLGKVYDVTGFLSDHPGGDDLILNYAGKDVDEIMKDKLEHEHSDAAYDMLDEYFIGRIGVSEAIVSDGMSQLPHTTACALSFLPRLGSHR